MTIQAANLRKEFARVKGGASFTAVDSVNLRVESGELVVIRGRSGSGKSTLVSMLAGVLVPSAGQVLLEGRDLYALGDEAAAKLRNEMIGVVPQGNAALRALSVLENVLLPSIVYGSHVSASVEGRGRELLETLGLGELADSSPHELSGGELRRLGVARALVMKPRVLVADEPTAGLDEANAMKVLSIFRDAAREGAAVLLASHEEEASRFADRVFTMDAGALS